MADVIGFAQGRRQIMIAEANQLAVGFAEHGEGGRGTAGSRWMGLRFEGGGREISWRLTGAQ
jgi:hypothetical protein